mmetsp:Transcript_13016/g.28266  ORF Transcript_13016/g.28266 Transcript_13016/m.28266 type:complete len:172 (-) Transcript_13016:275-790(-)|eukprot:CAMPEP_0172298580 /NCGR_PEP_ID=MMETSP1058-20130122/1170_1 /TAXON_ID=83371 /ORGANISM="Detonula confervacea, Strain CCMP 353" /LENGTH=171 /DNA_ID=CAMNT_0013007859 /DNA_START=182 /DNA_END=697 /DNA_ORIENTATION=+
MVLYTLSLQATLESVSSIKWDDAEKLLCCTIQHPTDPSDVKEKVVVDFSELEEPTEERVANTSKPTHNAKKRGEKPCHFHVTWSDGTKGSVRVVQLNTPNDDVHSDEWFPVMSLECENAEPTAFYPLGKEFMVTNRSGTEYNNVDLSTGGWREYDMSSGDTSIIKLASKFS